MTVASRGAANSIGSVASDSAAGASVWEFEQPTAKVASIIAVRKAVLRNIGIVH
jgi:hypothetical protein